MDKTVTRVLKAIPLLVISALCLAFGAQSLQQGILEFRLRFLAQDLFADTSAENAALQAEFIIATADKYPANSKLQATAFRVAILLDALNGDAVNEADAVALAMRGQRRLLSAPSNPFLWINQANVAAGAFEEVAENDPALEALLKSFELGLYEFQLFTPRSLFCLFYVEDSDTVYGQACARQSALYEALMPEEYTSFKAAYDVTTSDG